MRLSKSPEIKICGITKLNQAKEIALLNVKAIGVIGVKDSKRFVKDKQRRAIFSELSNYANSLKRVWVIADLNDEEIDFALTGQGQPSVIQLHGNESIERVKYLRQNHPKVEWWKAIRLRSPKDLQLANEFSTQADALLLDSWRPDKLGGTGNRVPLEWLKDFSIKPPWWLAGGICAEWIPEVLSAVKPWGIDASSKLEVSPGVKDLNQVEALVNAVQKQANYF